MCVCAKKKHILKVTNSFHFISNLSQIFTISGRYNEALSYYEKGLQVSDQLDDKQILSCYSGIARMAIRTGDYQRGLKIALGPISTKQLLNECAELFDNVKVICQTVTKDYLFQFLYIIFFSVNNIFIRN